MLRTRAHLCKVLKSNYAETLFKETFFYRCRKSSKNSVVLATSRARLNGWLLKKSGFEARAWRFLSHKSALNLVVPCQRMTSQPPRWSGEVPAHGGMGNPRGDPAQMKFSHANRSHKPSFHLLCMSVKRTRAYLDQFLGNFSCTIISQPPNSSPHCIKERTYF